ncbi:hypothetical protein BYT27DRAFT_7076476, partial [Phlegmacium glaucopus]
VGWITCDNAANNLTMLRHFGKKLNLSKMRQDCKTPWNWETFHIRCLAHVINLATQALLSTYSSASHFDPEAQHDYDPDDALNEDKRDEVGLIRAITVKVSFRVI